MLINLFDALWPQSSCSTAHQTSEYIEYVRNQMDFDGVTIFTDAHLNEPIVDEVRSRYKIGWLREPYCLHPETYDRALENVHKFDFILTHYKPFLERPGFRFCPYGGIWIDRAEWGIKLKTKNISMLSGDKLATGGHRLRRQIADYIADNELPVDLYGYRGEPVDYGPEAKLKVLADYRFSIVTETCWEDNLFTEWLLDCLIVGTVPVFWGCPNVGDYFKGVPTFTTFNDAIVSIDQITQNGEDIYKAMMPIIEMNYRLALNYAVMEDWIYLRHLRGWND